MRAKKISDDRARAREKAEREKRFKSLYASNKSDAARNALKNVKGLKEGSSLFEYMRSRGEGVTFSSSGVPLIYKQTPARQEVYEHATFELKPSKKKL